MRGALTPAGSISCPGIWSLSTFGRDCCQHILDGNKRLRLIFWRLLYEQLLLHIEQHSEKYHDHNSFHRNQNLNDKQTLKRDGTRPRTGSFYES